MLTSDDLAQIQLIVREELARILHPSAQRTAPVVLPLPDNDPHPPTPTQPAA